MCWGVLGFEFRTLTKNFLLHLIILWIISLSNSLVNMTQTEITWWLQWYSFGAWGGLECSKQLHLCVWCHGDGWKAVPSWDYWQECPHVIIPAFSEQQNFLPSIVGLQDKLFQEMKATSNLRPEPQQHFFCVLFRNSTVQTLVGRTDPNSWWKKYQRIFGHLSHHSIKEEKRGFGTILS